MLRQVVRTPYAEETNATFSGIDLVSGTRSAVWSSENATELRLDVLVHVRIPSGRDSTNAGSLPTNHEYTPTNGGNNVPVVCQQPT
jgi:hypothetical protein